MEIATVLTTTEGKSPKRKPLDNASNQRWWPPWPRWKPNPQRHRELPLPPTRRQKTAKAGGSNLLTRPAKTNTDATAGPARQPGRPPLKLLVSHLRKTAEEKSTATYCKYLNIRLNGVAVSAMVDSGNTWRSEISSALCRRLGVEQEELGPKSLLTVFSFLSGILAGGEWS